jgi:hypothetical protein
MSRIEKGLHEHHARMAEQAQNNPTAANSAQMPPSAPPAALEAPFAKVNSVVAGSPADEAGLKMGDSITKFGWVDWTNHERLGRVAEAVTQNEGVSGLNQLCWQHCSLARRLAAQPILKDMASKLTTTRFRLRSKLCDRAAQAVRPRLCRCSLHRGGIGADEACWAAIYFHCSPHPRSWSLKESAERSRLPKQSSMTCTARQILTKHCGGWGSGSRDSLRWRGLERWANNSACCVAQWFWDNKHDTRAFNCCIGRMPKILWQSIFLLTQTRCLITKRKPNPAWSVPKELPLPVNN